MQKLSKVILLLGGNIGDRAYYLNNAINLIRKEIGKVLICSSVYESAPWGFEDANAFYNQVVVLETTLDAMVVLKKNQFIEKKLGRTRNANGYESRCIDIDILFFDDLILNEANLQIPHPRLHLRRFTLMPLVEILPDFIHPVFRKTMQQLFDECKDLLMVKKIK